MIRRFSLFLIIAFSPFARADEAFYRLDTVEITGQAAAEDADYHGAKSQYRISGARSEKSREQNVAQALSNQRGIDVQSTCANCGAKRVMLNGMKGEHSTVLIDGVPALTSSSAFYGIDALPVSGVESIDIFRGTGNALSFPESIGGAVDIRTQRIDGNAFSLDSYGGNGGTHYLSLVGMRLSKNGDWGFLVSAQNSGQSHWDEDRNRVSESPDLSMSSAMFKLQYQPSDRLKIETRYSQSYLSILGGTTTDQRPVSYRSGFITDNHYYKDRLFPNSDVRAVFSGDQSFITDFIRVRRTDIAPKIRYKLGSSWELESASVLAYQRQESIYLHGYDYENRDRLAYTRLSARGNVSDALVMGWGIELKNQTMLTRSVKLFDIARRTRDAFRANTQSAFVDANFFATDFFEIDAALRFDRFQVRWLANRPTLSNIEKNLVSPRVSTTLTPHSDWKVVTSYGRGFRVPLSFFESQHGLTEQGFEMRVKEPETSDSVGIDIERSRGPLTLGTSHYATWIKNMAYGDQNIIVGEPVVFRNVADRYRVVASDVKAGVKFDFGLESEIVAEKFLYADGYAMKLPVAPVEERIRFINDLHLKEHEFTTTFTWIGARDLTKYNYRNRFKNLGITPDPFGDPTFDQIYGGERKFQRAPSFFTLDLAYAYLATRSIKLTFAITNVFDFTQTGESDSPLNWNQHGADPQHFHLDNNALWGPNRGRIFTAGLRVDL